MTVNKRKKIIFFSLGILLLAGVFFLIIHLTTSPKPVRKFRVRTTQLTPIRNRIHIDIRRYEKDLFNLDLDNLPKEIERISARYPDELIQKGIWNDPQMMARLKAYLEDPVIRDIYDEVMKVYPDLDELTVELEDALTYYRYYYPDAEIPAFYTLVPGIDFTSPTVFGVDSNIFINLDMYLGPDYKYYSQYGIPKYISARYDGKYIAIDCFKKALVYKYLPQDTKFTLLENMIYEGKKLYFTELMFPKRNEEDIIGYPRDKFDWAVKHQYDIWNYLVGKNELFSKAEKELTAYIREAPFTKVFGNTSPGRLGIFIGWKIVQSYMENNPDITLQELMGNTDARMILNQSQYKPSAR